MPKREASSRGTQFTVQAVDRSFRGTCFTVVSKMAEIVNEQQKRTNEGIDRLGSKVQIIRNEIPIAYSVAILMPIRSTAPASLAVNRNISIKTDDDIQTGDYLLDIKRSEYYIYLTGNEFLSEDATVGISGMAAKCNHTVSIFRSVDKPSGAGGTKAKFELVHPNVDVALEFLKGYMSQAEMGFYQNSTHRMYVPAYYGLKVNDRIKLNDDYLKIDAIDSTTYGKVDCCAVTRDRR
jgi:hypothetical protein